MGGIKRGRRKKKDDELYVAVLLRMDKWLDGSLKILFEIDKRRIGNKGLQYSVWLRGILFKEVDRRGVEIEAFKEVFREMKEKVVTGV